MEFLKKIKKLAALTILGLASIGSANATLINMNGLLQNGVVFGSGNANGSFSGINQNGIELGLRGKLRYDLAGNPQNIFNYDGDRSYFFDPADSNAPANRSIWNFEFSIDVINTMNGTLADSGYTFLLGVDNDPSALINNASSPVGFNPLLFPDNAGGLGVAQNSQNLGFGYTILNPQLNGIYTISLSAIGANETFSTSIDIIVGPLRVPEPGTLSLLALAIISFSLRRVRQS